MLDIAGYPLVGTLSSSTTAVRRTVWAFLLFWIWIARSQILPYTPTTILLPQCGPSSCQGQSSHDAFIFYPDDSSVNLLSIDVSSTVHARSLNVETLTSGLPFLDDEAGSTAFTASISDDGTITVLAGDCSSKKAPSVWTFNRTSGQTKWAQHYPTTNGPAGPSFLGGSLSFSSTIAPVPSPPVTYVYGGMCPWSNASTSTWQSAASYSNQMLKISTQDPGPDAAYTVRYASNNGPPIADAGFTFTPLVPSIANRSGTVTQQANSVLLGGHTQGAFINMSTAALWSLPEESWTFLSINAPAGNPNTELAIKNTITGVESRSGHTAVLTEDGSSLVILGGWVGDITQAAEPQLAVLEMGSSFDDWQWSNPVAQPPGPGIYGHGATLLPGNVMMVYGGYSVSSSPSSRVKRRQIGASNEVPMFLNLTSMAWTDEYTHPTASSKADGGGSTSSSPSPSGSNSKSKKIGLGVGLGVGIPLAIAAIVLGVCYRRHANRQRAHRDQVVRNLSQDAARFLNVGNNHDEMLERDHGGDAGIFPWNPAAARDWYTGGPDAYARGQRSLGYESLRGQGKLSPFSYPPPLPPVAAGPSSGRSRGSARGLYQPTNVLTSSSGGGSGGYDFGSPHRIPPIYEADEDEGPEDGDTSSPSGSPSSPEHNHHPDDDGDYDDDDEGEGAGSDPFLTPTATTPRGSGIFAPSSRAASTPSPEGGRGPATTTAVAAAGQDHDVRDWVSDVDAADALLAARISAHGTTTTTTPTSDEGRPPSSMSESGRSILSQHQNYQPLSRSGSVRSARQLQQQQHHHHHRRRHSRAASPSVAEMARLGSSSGSSSHTWGTAKSNLAGLRDEGPGLLRGGGGEDDEYEDEPGSPSKNRPRRSWFGSLRRVFSGSPESGSSGSRGGSPTREGLMGGSSDCEARPAGGQMLRRKQGREAWEGEGEGGDGLDDWDVERAVEQRLVQVMFTVPKERLRVVNAEIEREEEVVVVDPDREGGEEKLGGDERPLEPMSKDELVSRTPSTIVHTAEAVRLDRPRTRVLEMVESIESQSRDNSPAGSPER
ncbi:hypothetical protein QBC33DRAFT_554865 [Phialemonium atrogriseum]|uniref:Uncharacterized protein n=1 Tax=Phialemonium atrogriseum TaxID=1093897 RepID=A0AAJ0FQX3_9PEZI|nr:uncharacterized protein QBC33DRAFT_554865 [Phialemonium atrogriseum]KAK1771703.1 hypothetical protein QBC33DRAFT_554865 [Phialemonium atrogriseum]